MDTLTNESGLGLAMAVWLAHDTYTNGAEDHPGENVISATSLIKPTRKLILENRAEGNERGGQRLDVTDLIPSRLGTAIHDSIEAAWKKGYAKAMLRLGYPKKLIARIRINPSDAELAADPNIFPVYLEQRYFRPIEVDGLRILISGKFDQIINGEVNDTKSTSVWSVVLGDKEEEYIQQGSLYRWINPTKVTSDIMRVQHFFTDFQKSMVGSSPRYPAQRAQELTVDLMSLAETEAWIKSKIREILINHDKDEPNIIRCSDKDLWMPPPTYKYYADPKKAAEGGRATKNFDTYPAAMNYRAQKGKGTVITVQNPPKACGYCGGYNLCTQKDEYFDD